MRRFWEREKCRYNTKDCTISSISDIICNQYGMLALMVSPSRVSVLRRRQFSHDAQLAMHLFKQTKFVFVLEIMSGFYCKTSRQSVVVGFLQFCRQLKRIFQIWKLYNMALSGFGKYCQTCSTNIEQAVVNDNPDILRNRQIMRITKCRAFCELLPLKKKSVIWERCWFWVSNLLFNLHCNKARGWGDDNLLLYIKIKIILHFF